VAYTLKQGDDVVASNLSDPSYTITGLAPGTIVNYTVTAANSLGESKLSLAISGSTAGAYTNVSPGTLPEPGVAPAGYSPTILDDLGVPKYTCVRDWYLDPNGNDGLDGTTPATAWATLSKADQNAKAGDCVNLASGVYQITSTPNLNASGSENTPTGYIVYRSVVQGGAVLRQMTDQHAYPQYDYRNWGFLVVINGSYLIFDGIEFDGNNFNVATDCISNTNVNPPGHHWVYENDIAHHCGTLGLGNGYGDYLWYINNLTYDNSNTNVTNEGGGIDAYEAKDATRFASKSGFVQNDADRALPYHVVIAFNITHDNIILPSGCPTPGCGTDTGDHLGTSHSDGNGIMFDNFDCSQSDSVPFPFASIALGNLSYNNGGAGILVGTSPNVTVANNTVYNNFTDNEIMNTQRGDIDVGWSNNALIVNNAVYAVQGSGTYTQHNSAIFYGYSGSTYHNAKFYNNIGYPSVNGPTASDGSNNLFGAAYDPLFTDAPNGDFTLQTGSPALGSGLSDTTTPWLTSGTSNIGALQP